MDTTDEVSLEETPRTIISKYMNAIRTSSLPSKRTKSQKRRTSLRNLRKSSSFGASPRHSETPKTITNKSSKMTTKLEVSRRHTPRKLSEEDEVSNAPSSPEKFILPRGRRRVVPGKYLKRPIDIDAFSADVEKQVGKLEDEKANNSEKVTADSEPEKPVRRLGRPAPKGRKLKYPFDTKEFAANVEKRATEIDTNTDDDDSRVIVTNKKEAKTTSPEVVLKRVFGRRRLPDENKTLRRPFDIKSFVAAVEQRVEKGDFGDISSDRSLEPSVDASYLSKSVRESPRKSLSFAKNTQTENLSEDANPVRRSLKKSLSFAESVSLDKLSSTLSPVRKSPRKSLSLAENVPSDKLSNTLSLVRRSPRKHLSIVENMPSENLPVDANPGRKSLKNSLSLAENVLLDKLSISISPLQISSKKSLSLAESVPSDKLSNPLSPVRRMSPRKHLSIVENMPSENLLEDVNSGRKSLKNSLSLAENEPSDKLSSNFSLGPRRSPRKTPQTNNLSEKSEAVTPIGVRRASVNRRSAAQSAGSVRKLFETKEKEIISGLRTSESKSVYFSKDWDTPRRSDDLVVRRSQKSFLDLIIPLSNDIDVTIETGTQPSSSHPETNDGSDSVFGSRNLTPANEFEHGLGRQTPNSKSSTPQKARSPNLTSSALRKSSKESLLSENKSNSEIETQKLDSVDHIDERRNSRQSVKNSSTLKRSLLNASDKLNKSLSDSIPRVQSRRSPKKPSLTPNDMQEDSFLLGDFSDKSENLTPKVTKHTKTLVSSKNKTLEKLSSSKDAINKSEITKRRSSKKSYKADSSYFEESKTPRKLSSPTPPIEDGILLIETYSNSDESSDNLSTDFIPGTGTLLQTYKSSLPPSPIATPSSTPNDSVASNVGHLQTENDSVYRISLKPPGKQQKSILDYMRETLGEPQEKGDDFPVNTQRTSTPNRSQAGASLVFDATPFTNFDSDSVGTNSRSGAKSKNETLAKKTMRQSVLNSDKTIKNSVKSRKSNQIISPAELVKDNRETSIKFDQISKVSNATPRLQKKSNSLPTAIGSAEDGSRKRMSTDSPGRHLNATKKPRLSYNRSSLSAKRIVMNKTKSLNSSKTKTKNQTSPKTKAKKQIKKTDTFLTSACVKSNVEFFMRKRMPTDALAVFHEESENFLKTTFKNLAAICRENNKKTIDPKDVLEYYISIGLFNDKEHFVEWVRESASLEVRAALIPCARAGNVVYP